MLRFLTYILVAMVMFSSANAQYKTKNVAVFVYDGVDILDIGAPGEILSSIMVSDENKFVSKAFNVYLVSLDNKDLTGKDFMKIRPAYTIYDCPDPDIVVVPGGKIDPLLSNFKFMRWLKYVSLRADKIMGVGSGVMALASSGILDGKQTVINNDFHDVFLREYPNVEIIHHNSFIDSNGIISTVGSANTIEATLQLVSDVIGPASAIAAAKYINYLPWLETSARLNPGK
jgi:transcriptional regulator GlxA family with amidase domain